MSDQSHRGNRLKPSHFHRIYYHLMSLKSSYIAVINDNQDRLHNARLIDFGCGNMPYRQLFEPLVERYIGCDLTGNDLAELVITEQGVLPIDARSIDIVLSSQVLEHVIDPRIYLEEAARVLKSDGLLILSTHGVWKYHPDPTDYWRWTSDGLKKQVHDAGFEICDFRGIMGPAATAIQLFQDTTGSILPWPLRLPYYFCCQLLMSLFDRMQKKETIDQDASVYLLVATPNLQKPSD